MSSSEIDRIFALQQANRLRVRATTAAERIAKLRKLHDAVMARRGEIRAAMWADYRKPASEVDLTETFAVVGEARHAIRHLRRWMRPRRVRGRLALLGTSSKIVHEPKGVVLIVAPWNFPVNLSLGPLVSAVAAGNCAIVKPSELTPESAKCIRRIVEEVFDESEVAVIEGDASVAQTLVAMKFDHIFFTGSPAVGKEVMKAAAANLTSVTLELGGKSPAIVDRTADLDEAARRIAWGKFLNVGQVCIAPDYLLVDEAIEQAFTGKLVAAIAKLGGTETRGWVVNERHAARVRKLFDDAVSRGARIVTGGEFGEGGRRVAPTVLAAVPPDSPLMNDEIFGPLLPIVTYRSREEAYGIIGAKEKPLVLYVFSRDGDVVDEVLARTSAGGTVVNHTLIHFYQLNLPFGGVANSGTGRGHGFYGFESFSNVRGVLEQSMRFSSIELLFPPYSRLKQKLIDITVRFL